MKRSSIRLCAPALLSTFLASSALTAATITEGLQGLGFVPQNAYGFGQDENGNLQFTLRDETVLQKLAGVEMPTTDASDDDPRFFKADDDGRYPAIVTHQDVAQMLAGKKLSESRWSNIITDLVDAAKISSLPPATRENAGARPVA